jgi:hypothetical protein
MTIIRTKLTPDERALPVRHYIDPGFVNERLVETVVGEQAVAFINEQIRAIAPETPDWVRRSRIKHIYTRMALALCSKIGASSLRAAIADGRGQLVCSTETLAPCPDIYTAKRVQIAVVLDGDFSFVAELDLTTSRISSDTLRGRLRQGGPQSFVAIVHLEGPTRLRLEPLVIGAPWLEIDDPAWTHRITWWGYDFFEHFVEDFDEFSEVKNEGEPNSFEEMASISENAFKTCLAEILGDTVVKDWGGERSDHFSAHLRLRGQRVTAAFLLKGPARFAPMTLNSLGKNNDQIFRLSSEPAELLVVQHCHDITPPVRATLRAFAVQPSRPRRYCLIDGRDSLRLLRAYGKVEHAKDLSERTE